MKIDTDLYISMADAAKKLGCNRCNIHSWIKRGKLRAVKIFTNCVIIRKKDLEKFIASKNIK